MVLLEHTTGLLPHLPNILTPVISPTGAADGFNWMPEDSMKANAEVIIGLGIVLLCVTAAAGIITGVESGLESTRRSW